MKKQVHIQASFSLSPEQYKRLVYIALNCDLKPSISPLIKKLVENVTDTELKRILSR